MQEQEIKLKKPEARFAKLYVSKKYGHVLVLKTTDPIGAPRLNVMFEVQKLGQVSVGQQYSNDIEGFDKVEADFEAYTKEQAEKVVSETVGTMIADLKEMKGKKEGICLQCGGVKFHNNSFCSAECARAWKKAQQSVVDQLVKCPTCGTMVDAINEDNTCYVCAK